MCVCVCCCCLKDLMAIELLAFSKTFLRFKGEHSFDKEGRKGEREGFQVGINSLVYGYREELYSPVWYPYSINSYRMNLIAQKYTSNTQMPLML